jgi:RNA polymerase sigma factor (sigma-70 family)
MSTLILNIMQKLIDFEKEEISEVLKKLIEKLPENHAAVISMYYLEEMSCEEISEVMKISVSNVKVMLYRSRNSLKELILKNNLMEELL